MFKSFEKNEDSEIPLFKKDDPKLGTIMSTGMEGDVVLIGFPFEEGVLRNGGRPGSSLGPNCLRQFIPKIGPIVNKEIDIDLSKFSISDAGNIEGEDFDTCHSKLKQKVSLVLTKPQKSIPFIIGGGNDQSWSNGVGFLNYCELKNYKPLIINIDAHLDVRKRDDKDQIHSGCPFRLLLEETRYKKLGGRFIEFACQGSQCAAEHVKFVEENNGQLIWMRAIRRKETKGKPLNQDLITQAGQALEEIFERLEENERVFLSFDVDSINSSHCPGVSCPSVDGGLTAEEAIEIAFLAGTCGKVEIMDMSEYNPSVEEYRTGRLLANIFYYFCLGCSIRK